MTMMYDRVNIERINGISNVITNTFNQEIETMEHGIALMHDIVVSQYRHDPTPTSIRTIISNQTYLLDQLELVLVFNGDNDLVFTYDEYSILQSLDFETLGLDRQQPTDYTVNYIDDNVYVFGQITLTLSDGEYTLVMAFISDLVEITLDDDQSTYFQIKAHDGRVILQDAEFENFDQHSIDYYTHVQKEIIVFKYPVTLEMFSHQSILEVFGYGNLWFTIGMIMVILTVYIFVAFYLFTYVMLPLRQMKQVLAAEIKSITADDLIHDPNYDVSDDNEIQALVKYYQFFIDSIKDLIDEVNTHRNKLNDVINSIHVGIIEIDAITHRINDINGCALDILGLEYNECIDQPCYDYLCTSLDCMHDSGISCIAETMSSDAYTFECEMVNSQTNKITPVLKSMVRIPYGDTTLILVTFINITDLKAKEEELRRAVGRADRATMGKTILLGNVSHDIGNILTTLKGNAEILQRHELTDEQYKIIDVIIDSSISIANAVELMRERTLLETGQSKLNLHGY